ARQMPGEEIDLADHMVEVAVRDAVMFRDDDVAAAEEAALLAERRVRVERERGVGQRVGRLEPRAELGLDEVGAELDRRRIGRVARTGSVVAGQQLERGGRCGRGAHETLPARPEKAWAIGSIANPWTVSISASTASIGVSGRIPWPRFMMCPGPRPSSSTARARSRTDAGGPSKACGARLPCSAKRPPVLRRASASPDRQHTPSTSAPAAAMSSSR